jgi:hypothetical protein
MQNHAPAQGFLRTAIGFEIDSGKLTTELPAGEALKPLKRIVLDLALKVKTVSDLKLKGQQEGYVANFKTLDRPDLTQKSGTAQTIESISQKDFSIKGATTIRHARTHRTAPRTSIVPRSCKLNVTTPKISGIYDELRRLLLARHVHSIAVMLRVFLEMSVDEYLTKVAGLSLKFKHPKSGHDLDKTLKTKVKETIGHLVQNGADPKDFLGVTKGLSDPNHPFSIEDLHAYIHNRFFTPIDTHLTAAWDNAQPLFEKIWP